MNDGFEHASVVWELIGHEPDIIGQCVWCERDIYQCEADEIFYVESGMMHRECFEKSEEKKNEII